MSGTTLIEPNPIDVNVIYNKFYDKLHYILDKYFPKVRISRKKLKIKTGL